MSNLERGIIHLAVIAGSSLGNELLYEYSRDKRHRMFYVDIMNDFLANEEIPDTFSTEVTRYEKYLLFYYRSSFRIFACITYGTVDTRRVLAFLQNASTYYDTYEETKLGPLILDAMQIYSSPDTESANRAAEARATNALIQTSIQTLEFEDPEEDNMHELSSLDFAGRGSKRAYLKARFKNTCRGIAQLCCYYMVFLAGCLFILCCCTSWLAAITGIIAFFVDPNSMRFLFGSNAD